MNRCEFGGIGAVEEFATIELHGDHSEDELEEQIDDENVEHVFEREYHTVEHRLYAIRDISYVTYFFGRCTRIQYVQI